MKKVIVLGGTHDHKRLIDLFKEMGYFTILVDYLENPPAKDNAHKFIRESTLDKNLVLDLAKSLNVDLVISTCVESALLTAVYVSEELGLPTHISYSNSIAITNKSIMKEYFLENDIPSAKYKILNSNDKFDFIDFNFPLVVKPVDSSSSKGVEKVSSIEEIKKSFDKAKAFSNSGKVIVEEFVEGNEISVDCFISDGIVQILSYSKSIKSQINEKNFTITGSSYPPELSTGHLEQLGSIAQKIAKAFQLSNGPLLIQVILSNNQVYVLECSARIGGGSKHHFIKHLTKIDILRLTIDAILGKEINDALLVNKRNMKYCHMLYLYCNNGTIKMFVGFDRLISDGVISEYFLYKSTGDFIRGSMNSSDRPAGVLVTANSLEEFIEKKEIIYNTIQILDENSVNLLKDIK